MGDNTFAPSSAAAVARHYRLGAGNLDVNLSAVTFPARGQAVEVTVGMGHLTVELPTNADVTVNAHVGLGHVDVWGHSGSDVQAQWPPGGTGPKEAPYLTLDAHVGVGDIEVTRGAPSSGPGAPLPPQRP